MHISKILQCLKHYNSSVTILLNGHFIAINSLTLKINNNQSTYLFLKSVYTIPKSRLLLNV